MSAPIEDKGLARQIETYLKVKLPNAGGLKLTVLRRIHGGASRQTYAVDTEYEEAGRTVTRKLILRRDPADSLIDTERRIEFAAIRSMEGTDLPVPKALYLEEGSKALGAPFFIMERIEVGVPAQPFRLEALDPHRESLGRQIFRHIGAIAAVDPAGSPLAEVIDTPTLETCWSRELDYWETEITQNARKPEPIARAAIRHLRRNPPPPAQKLSIVHGDFRVGNFLHNEAGRVTGILDWEMAHIGDPYEDFAWMTDPLWSGGDLARAGGVVSWPEAIAEWELSSGCKFDFGAFEWWSIFASVKAIGIWITSARAFADGANDDPILAWSGWFTHAAHERILAARLSGKYKA